MYFLYVAEPAGAFTQARSSMVMKRVLSSSIVVSFSAINGSTGLRVLGVGRWSLLGDSCGQHLGLLLFVDLDPTDEFSERRYVTS
jgi:hypothetical protein